MNFQKWEVLSGSEVLSGKFFLVLSGKFEVGSSFWFNFLTFCKYSSPMLVLANFFASHVLFFRSTTVKQEVKWKKILTFTVSQG